MFYNLIILLMLLSSTDCDMELIRRDYHGIRDKNSQDEFLSTYRNKDCKTYTPYVASVIMQQAQYAGMPTKKLKYFREGKSMLEDYISHNPDDLEARYVRVLVQENIPGILGYKDNIDSDKSFVASHIDSSTLPEDYKKLIKKNLEL